jgi:calcineurin-like phosphoesterase family protein
VLIRGNHDKKSIDWYIQHGWDFVVDSMHVEFAGKTVLLSHKPRHPDEWRYSLNIHGHTHGTMHHSEEYVNYYSDYYHYDLSPEVVGYKINHLPGIIKKVQKQRAKK